jgi:hypothetical protein
MKITKSYRKRAVVAPTPRASAAVNIRQDIAFYRIKIAYLESVKRELVDDNYLMLGNVSRLQGRNGILDFHIKRRLN